MRKVLYILGALEDSDLQWMLDAGEPRGVARDEVLIQEGSPQASLYVVVDGELSVRKGDRELARLGAGEIVGEMSFLDSRPPVATIVAEQDSVVFDISHARLHLRLQTDTAFAARFYRAISLFLANRLSRADALVGAGARTDPTMEEGSEDEISPDALQNVALAGARFDWFLHQIRSA